VILLSRARGLICLRGCALAPYSGGMTKFLARLFAFCVAAFLAPCAALFANADVKGAAAESEGGVYKILRVPFTGVVAKPKVYIINRALETALSQKFDAVIIDMDTPGGDMASTLEIMEALSKFEGKTACYVNTDAISAGSYIAIVCDEIWFAPSGLMGAAEAVASSGEDINESMQRKISSFMKAKVRALSHGHKYRADVQRAMMDPDFEFRIGEKVIKEKGALLTLTAKEAAQEYDGAKLLGDGIEGSVQKVASRMGGGKNAQIAEFEFTLAEKISEFIQGISAVLIGLGIALIVIEFKTPGFGIIGALGIAALFVVFAGTYMAGLSGYEEILLFIIGVGVVAADLLFFGPLLLPSVAGVFLMFAALAMALSGQSPSDGTDIDLSMLLLGFRSVAWGIMLSFVFFAGGAYLLAKAGYYKKMAPSENLKALAAHEAFREKSHSLQGLKGVAASDLRPTGKIEVGGRFYEASCALDSIAKGRAIQVVGKKNFYWLVKEIDSENIQS